MAPTGSTGDRSLRGSRGSWGSCGKLEALVKSVAGAGFVVGGVLALVALVLLTAGIPGKVAGAVGAGYALVYASTLAVPAARLLLLSRAVWLRSHRFPSN